FESCSLPCSTRCVRGHDFWSVPGMDTDSVRFPELLHGGGAAQETRETVAVLRNAVFPAADGSTRDGKSARRIHPANTHHYVAVCAPGESSCANGKACVVTRRCGLLGGERL